jgi:hypothetical protein
MQEQAREASRALSHAMSSGARFADRASVVGFANTDDARDLEPSRMQPKGDTPTFMEGHNQDSFVQDGPSSIGIYEHGQGPLTSDRTSNMLDPWP